MSITIRIEQQVVTTHTVDLVEFYTNLPQSLRDRYWQTDPVEWGFEDESDRPFAFITEMADLEVSSGLDARPGVRLQSPAYPDVRVEVARADGPFRWGSDDLDENDFDTLTDAVPWLRPTPDPADMSASEYEDYLRLPGDGDVPLFDLHALG